VPQWIKVLLEEWAIHIPIVIWDHIASIPHDNQPLSNPEFSETIIRNILLRCEGARRPLLNYPFAELDVKRAILLIARGPPGIAQFLLDKGAQHLTDIVELDATFDDMIGIGPLILDPSIIREGFGGFPLVLAVGEQGGVRDEGAALSARVPIPASPRMNSRTGAVLASCCNVDKFVASRTPEVTCCLAAGLVVTGCVALREILVVEIADLPSNDSIELRRRLALVILQVSTLVGSKSTANKSRSRERREHATDGDDRPSEFPNGDF
jgi:hypothetical protein